METRLSFRTRLSHGPPVGRSTSLSAKPRLTYQPISHLGVAFSWFLLLFQGCPVSRIESCLIVGSIKSHAHLGWSDEMRSNLLSLADIIIRHSLFFLFPACNASRLGRHSNSEVLAKIRAGGALFATFSKYIVHCRSISFPVRALTPQTIAMACSEEDLGIRCWINSKPGFTGILKHRHATGAPTPYTSCPSLCIRLPPPCS
jgi:hypothetical protein